LLPSKQKQSHLNIKNHENAHRISIIDSINGSILYRFRSLKSCGFRFTAQNDDTKFSVVTGKNGKIDVTVIKSDLKAVSVKGG
jgi:hypothetical protein